MYSQSFLSGPVLYIQSPLPRAIIERLVMNERPNKRQRSSMATQSFCQNGLEGQPGALVPFDRNDYHHSWSCPPETRRQLIHERLDELRQFTLENMSSSKACNKTLNDFWAITSEWHRQVFQQKDVELHTTRERLAASQAALQKEEVACSVLQQAHATMTAEIERLRDRLNEQQVQLGMCKQANASFVDVNATLSKTLYNLTTYPDETHP